MTEEYYGNVNGYVPPEGQRVEPSNEADGVAQPQNTYQGFDAPVTPEFGFDGVEVKEPRPVDEVVPQSSGVVWEQGGTYHSGALRRNSEPEYEPAARLSYEPQVQAAVDEFSTYGKHEAPAQESGSAYAYNYHQASSSEPAAASAPSYGEPQADSAGFDGGVAAGASSTFGKRQSSAQDDRYTFQYSSHPESVYKPAAEPSASYSAPTPPYSASEPSHSAPRYESAKPAGGAAAAKQGPSALQMFLLALAGAVVGGLLVFAGLSLTGKIGGGTTATSGGGTVITVEGEDTTLAEVVAQKSLPSVCCVYVYTKQASYSYGYGWGYNNQQSDTLTQSSLGSGVILTADGYIITNYHVIEGAAAIKVTVGDTQYDAELVGSDASSDIAVIKVNATDLTPIEIGDSDNLKIGEWVMSIGSPFGLEQSVATGIVSATSRSQIISDDTETTMVYTNLIQTDAAINPGNSGGALVNANGELIGINTLITSYSGNYSGVGFAIPVNYAKSLADQIIKGETPSHSYMGVSLTTVTSSLAQRYKLDVSEGAYVNVVESGSAADKAGLEAGDIIVKFDGKAVTSASDLMLAIRSKNPGDTVEVTYIRNGSTQNTQVTLGSDA